jgi:hypothetical protein
MGRPVGSLLCVSEAAAEFEGLFREVYLTFHRRDAPRSGMAGASRAVLQHLVLDGLPAETAAALLAALRGLLAHAPNARSPEGTPP